MNAKSQHDNKSMQFQLDELLHDLDVIEKELDRKKRGLDDLYDKAKSLVKRRIGEINTGFD